MAFEISIAVISEIVKGSLVAAAHQTCYSFCFNKYIDDLQRKKGELTITKESVQNRLEKAKRETKKVDILVVNWLEKVNSLLEEVQKLEEKANPNKSYCFGHFPNWIWRYRVAKLVEEKTKEVIELSKKGNNFPEFARPSTPPGMKYFSSQGFFYFENTRKAYDGILEALEDVEVSMIGLYGMGGCGKTTLAKQLGRTAEKTFDKVAFAVVSNKVDVQKIQGEIASYLNLNLKEEETMLGRARILFARLTSGEKILIILDDVWGKLDFEAIGIPLGESRKGCKVLLTSRRLQVCTLMGCQRSISLSLLNEEEAWVLFQNHSRMGDETSSPLKGLARDIAKECKGLPVAIAAVASTLKGKSLSEWQEALERLREATPIDVEEGLIDPYQCLQLSYDYLKNEETKSLFLLCSVFPEDFEIHEEFLARYGIGLGLFGKVSSYARSRNKVSEAINKLTDSCLLLKGNKEQCVKMHDLVRDMALFIAKKEKNVIMGIESKQSNSTLEDNYGAIRYLWHFKTQESDNLSYLLGCSKLEFLYVKISKHSALEDGVFKTMKDLRVLIIQGEHYLAKKDLSVAKSIQLLTNLRCLLLEEWSLGDISFIGCLKKLESLVLWFCSFEELPNEITELSELKLLDLWNCVIERNPDEVIRRCSQLEELYFRGNRGRWDREIAVVATSTLKRYRIDIGRCHQDKLENFHITRGLWLKYFDDMSSNAAIKELAQRAEMLELEGIKNDCKNIIPDMVATKGGMNQLTTLHLSYCDKIECLVEKIENAFPNLVNLYISNMNSLETWWRGPHEGKLNLFCSLKILWLSYCPMLTSVFTCAIAQSMVVLETLEIRGCDGIKQIVRDEEKDNDEKYSTSMFPRLQEFYVQGPRRFLCLQNFQKLWVIDCAKLKIIFSTTVFGSLPRLEILEVINCPQLEQIIEDGETLELTNELNRYPKNNRSEEFDDTSKKPGTSKCLSLYKWLSRRALNLHKLKTNEEDQKNQNGERVQEVQRHVSMFPRLKYLYIKECGLLQSIFPISFARDLLKLETLSVRNCNIHAVFQLEGFPITSEQNPLISGLDYLRLENLPVLTFLCKGPKKSLNLKYLSDLTVERCRNLIFIFSSSVLRSLPLLKFLTIKQCEQLQQIIEEDEKDDYSLSYHSQQVCFPSLTRIEVENCINLKYLFTILSSHELPQLNYLNLQECFLLENVFAQVESYTKDERGTIFSGLIELRLIQLPNLINIYKGFMWRSVKRRTVQDCPKLTSTIDQNQESKEAHETPNETLSMDGTLSANTANAIQQGTMDLQSKAPLTNSKKGKDTGLQTLTGQDGNMSAPLAPINQEYLTLEKGGNIKEMENKNVTEQSTTTYPESTEGHQKLVGTVFQESSLHAAPFPQIVPKEYSQNDSGIISDKATNIDKGRGDLQTQGLNTSVNNFNTEERHQEQNTNLREFIGETITESVQKGPASVKSTTETSSLEMVRKATMSDPVSMGHHQEANKAHLGDRPIDLNLNKATDAEQKMPQVSSENKEEEFVNDSIFMEQQKTPDEMDGDASVDLPTLEVEYGTFRDFGAMKKKHVPLIEKAFANHPSLRDWHKKFTRPEMKRLGYTILGNTLEFLESTRWRDFTEEKKAEFESLVNGMEAFGFDIQWLGNTPAKIKHSKLDDESIKQKQMLEEKVAEEQRQVEEIKVRLQKYKLELEAIEAELGNYNDFVGF